MSIKECFLTIVTWILITSLLCSSEMRVWESKKGSKITAEVLYVGETLVVFKTDQGKEISASIDSLVEADVVNLKLRREEAGSKPELDIEKEAPAVKVTPEPVADVLEKEPEGASKAPVVRKGDHLPILAEGKGKGFHAYYEGTKYVAKVMRNGFLIVHYKDEKGNVDERWRMLIRAMSQRAESGGWERFAYEKMLKVNPAQEGVKEVKYTFQSETGIRSDVIFEFMPEGFTTWTRSDNSAKTPEETIHVMHHNCGVMGNVSTDEEYLKKCKLKIETSRNGNERYDYMDVVSLKGNTEECEISGPFFEKTKLIIERAKDENVKFTPSQSSNKCLSDGYAYNTIKKNWRTSNHESEKTKVTFK